MAFRPDPAANLAPFADSDALARLPVTTRDGAAARAKTLARRFQSRGGPGDPGRSPPPFSPDRSFTADRMENSDSYRQWGDLFRNSTAMGFDFGAPPPDAPAGQGFAGPGPESKPKEEIA